MEVRTGKDRTRTSAFGVQGLSPYWFEFEPTLFVSEDEDISSRITVDYDLLLTQRLILQPRLETVVALQKAEEFGVGRGVKELELGLRLRYEIRRKFAPYVGASWRRSLGPTETLERDEGKDVQELSLTTGLRLWF